MNTLIQYPLPDWVSTAFLIFIPAPFILILYLFYIEGKKIQHFTLFKATAAFFTIYLAYIVVASFNGLFSSVFFPPKVILLATLPYGLFLFVWVLKTKTFRTFLENVPLERLVILHIFRLIGVFFLILAYYQALPRTFATVAGIGDILTALTSIGVYFAIKKKKTFAKTLTYVWNVFGTIDILITAIAANVLTKLSIDSGTMGVDTLARFPFCIIPAFAPPTIIFLHWLIFTQSKKHFT